jgi:hypothetical protein
VSNTQAKEATGPKKPPEKLKPQDNSKKNGPVTSTNFNEDNRKREMVNKPPSKEAAAESLPQTAITTEPTQSTRNERIPHKPKPEIETTQTSTRDAHKDQDNS